jgi:hypothetical protein
MQSFIRKYAMLNAEIYTHATAKTEELHRNAYNAAFRKLGLNWFWDTETYESLLTIGDEQQRIRRYLETEQRHLLSAYDVDFLVEAIQLAKTRSYETMAAGGVKNLPPANWLPTWGLEVGN